jgi:hypothetical protein
MLQTRHRWNRAVAHHILFALLTLLGFIGEGCFVFAAEPAPKSEKTPFPARLLSEMTPQPEQPGEDTWKFVQDLQSPLWSEHGWSPREVASGEADLRKGLRIDAQFPDPEGLLKTAYQDLGDFLTIGKVPQDGPFIIETARAETSVFEAYRIEITPERCRILAADTEGIRRGLFQVEDMMLRAGGPFLPLGTVERKPFIKSRISRCFFGPINRPPKNRDELLDDVDYYPDQYLNRMAHEGINGLWLSIEFKDLCKTSVVPEFGHDVEKRLAKLSRTVEKCRRYGIRIYIFANEPMMWSAGLPSLNAHPELHGSNSLLFCPGSETSQKYLYEATNGIFAAVPHLAGLINISHGERPMTCLSEVGANDNTRPHCKICSQKEPWEVIYQTLSPMAKGMHDANPDAELIAWFYMPETGELGDWVYEIPKHVPEHVTVQFNFESDVTRDVFGKGRTGGDYWISTPGPSSRFERIANIARNAGTSISAKIQTACSHEVATAPVLPTPGLLYQKFRAMRELGVNQVMLCWYFGNYPGIMNKAAGELSFEPFPKTEDEFLRQLAGPDWGKHSDTVVKAWRSFAEGYSHFPLTNFFQYWGPMHDGVVWPLLLRPQDAPLAPTWLLSALGAQAKRIPYQPSGDRIGEALGTTYTLAETIEECRKMSNAWDQGLTILRPLESDPALTPERRLDLGVAKALGIQFHSGENILRFYDLRERMAKEKPAAAVATLKEMRPIVEAELKGDEELLGLCEKDSRLGFHSEAEGYKYFPEKIRWRMKQLRELLEIEMPALQKELEQGVDVFAEYAGRTPTGPVAHSRFCADIEQRMKSESKELPENLDWQTCTPSEAAKSAERATRWACCHDRNAFYLVFDATGKETDAAKAWSLVLSLEPRRMWQCYNMTVLPTGGQGVFPPCEFEFQTKAIPNGWRGFIRVPFAAIAMDPTTPGPLRINVRRPIPDQGNDDQAWLPRHPWPYRLLLCSDNPADLGWVFFDKSQQQDK